MNKSFWKSKTIWLQVVTILSTFVPQVQEFVSGNPVTFVSFLGAVGTAVRFVTDGKITLFEEN